MEIKRGERTVSIHPAEHSFGFDRGEVETALSDYLGKTGFAVPPGKARLFYNGGCDKDAYISLRIIEPADGD